MQAKRKRDEKSPEQRELSQSPSVEPSQEDVKQQTSSGPKVFPRKRVAIACDLCRYRKIRCDGGRPKCGSCVELGRECNYLPISGISGLVVQQPDNSILHQQIATLTEQVNHLTKQVDALATNTVHANHTHGSPLWTDTASQHSVGTPHGSHTDRVVSRLLEQYPQKAPGDTLVSRPNHPRMPNMIAFRRPSLFRNRTEGWDDTKVFYSEQLSAGKDLHRDAKASQDQADRVSRQTVQRLQHSFVDNFLNWFPICNLGDCADHVEQAVKSGFDSSPSTCFTMFMLAVGAVCEYHAERDGPMRPGIAFFGRGRFILETFVFEAKDELVALQCRILQTVYYSLQSYFLLASETITQASRACINLLLSNLPSLQEAKQKNLLERVFWTCSVFSHEHEMCLMLHPFGIRQFHDSVPFPSPDNEASGWYYFLAQTSMRKLWLDVVDVVGFQRGQMSHAPIVASELRTQLAAWYNYLPQAVRFPLDATPTYNLQKASLRGQYYGVLALITWPAVLELLGLQDRGLTASSTSNDIGALNHQADECIKSCALMLRTFEECLSRPNLGSNLMIWASYSVVMMLLLVYRSPALSFIPETRDENLIKSGYEILSAWNQLPALRRGLIRAQEMMLLVNISIPTS